MVPRSQAESRAWRRIFTRAWSRRSCALRLALLCALLSVFACRAPEVATEVLVVVDTDFKIGEELDHLDIQVFDPTGKFERARWPMTLTEGMQTGTQYAVKLSFSLYPGPGVSDFRLVVTGSGPLGPDGAHIEIVQLQSKASFLEHERLLLVMYLERTCLREFCLAAGQTTRGDLTCHAGVCEPVPVLPPKPAGPGAYGGYDGSVAPSDGVDVRDAGPKSDGPDAAPRDAQTLSEAGEAVRTDAGTDPGSDSAVDSGPVDSGPVDSGPADSGPVVVVDSGPVVVDSGPVAVDTGVQTDTGVAGDAGRPTCGRWVASDKTAAPPVGAVPYGVEYNFDAPNIHDQYVCRGTTVPQKVPGKGVYPYSCYFIGLDTNATEAADDTFEVLTDTASCAQMTPIATAQANGIATWLSTGTGPAGEALYSCHGTEISVDTSKPVSAPLGRYDPGSNRCLYEWMQSTKASPVGAGFSILTYL